MKLAANITGLDPRMVAWVSLAFAIALVVATAIEIVLWRSETLLAFIVPFTIYTLVSLRLLPWRTPTRRAFSTGLLLGMFTPLILYWFGYPL
jgi:hypothetical protein